jgi:hypothetical protein
MDSLRELKMFDIKNLLEFNKIFNYCF